MAVVRDTHPVTPTIPRGAKGRLSNLSALGARASVMAIFGSVVADEVGTAYLALLAAVADGRTDEAGRQRALLFRLLAAEAELYPEELVGDAWQNHLLDRLIGDDNPFSLKAQCTTAAAMGQSLWGQTRVELATLRELYDLSDQPLADLALESDGVPSSSTTWRGFEPLGHGAPLHTPNARAFKRRLAESADWPALAEELADFYRAEGSGLFGRYRAFRWTRRAQAGHAGHLEGIAHPDPIRLEELIAYDRERALLIENTEQFLDGYPANNVLLYGERGTGKSSTIKALLNAYADRGLRLIEVPKQLLGDFPYILAPLRGRRERFIMFVDDLSFDEHETIYRELKAVLEGSLEARPENLLVYATSNRRHLVVERFSDHDAPDDAEIHSMDAVQEKLSLSDRFGVRLLFIAPDQHRYLHIVRGLVEQRGLDIRQDELDRRALQWATWQNGRGGRTARQFVDHLTGQLARGRGSIPS
jgi:predicted AAA+ superfamily ATPase